MSVITHDMTAGATTACAGRAALHILVRTPTPQCLDTRSLFRQSGWTAILQKTQCSTIRLDNPKPAVKEVRCIRGPRCRLMLTGRRGEVTESLRCVTENCVTTCLYTRALLRVCTALEAHSSIRQHEDHAAIAAAGPAGPF